MDTTASTGRLRRSLLLSFVVSVLSLAVVFANPETAAAYTVPTPVVLGEELAANPEAALGCLEGGAVGAAVCAVGVGAFLYATHDTWMPVVSGLLNKAFGGATGTAGYPSGCLVGVVPQVLLSLQTIHITASGQGNVCGGWSDSGFSVDVQSLQCRNTTTNVTYSRGNASRSMSTVSLDHPWSINADVSPALCGSGEVVSYAKARLYRNAGSTDFVDVGEGWSDSNNTTTTDVTCQKPDGTTTVLSLTINANSSQVPFPSCKADWDPTSRPKQAIIKAGPTGTTPVKKQTLTVSPDWETAHPDCFGPSGLQCTLRVYVDGVPCHVGDYYCVDWMTTAGTSHQVQCKFGTYTLDLSQCRVLRRAYQTDTTVKTLTTTDPATGGPDTATTDPAAPPSLTTGTNPGTAPGIDTTTSPDSSNCFGTGWSWNPVSWVYVPVKCALKWAFVPRQQTLQDTTNAMKTDAQNTVAWTWINGALNALPQPPSEGGDCAGPSFTVPIGSTSKTFQPFNACAQPVKRVADVTKGLLGVGVIAVSAMAVMRILGIGTFGFNPFGNKSGGDST